MANNGIMHAAHTRGGRPFCKNRNAHMSTTIENYLKEPKPCKRCMPTVQKQLALKAKGVKMPAAFEKTTDAGTMTHKRLNVLSEIRDPKLHDAIQAIHLALMAEMSARHSDAATSGRPEFYRRTSLVYWDAAIAGGFVDC